MRTLILISLMAVLAAGCGKDSKSSNSGVYGVEALTANGIIIQSTGGGYGYGNPYGGGGGVIIMCQPSNVTNAQRLQVIQGYLSSLGVSTGQYGQMVMINGQYVDQNRLRIALQQAAQVLSMYGGGNMYTQPYPYNNGYGQMNNQCPGQILGQG